MKTFNKLLIATTMVAALGMSVSCNSQNNTSVAGLPYTYVRAGYVEGDKVKIKFNCEGKNMKTYWGDDPEKATTETSHTFEGIGTEIYFIVEGDITSFSLCDKNGNALEEGNKETEIIIFSNTIRSIPANAFYDCRATELTYIPASVKKVGKNAFFYSNFICEVPSRPSGWDPNWCAYSSASTMTFWGMGFYITDNDSTYILITDKKIRAAIYAGKLVANASDKNIEVPETLDVNGAKYTVTEIMTLNAENKYVETIKVPKTIQHVSSFEYAHKLKEVTFADKYDFLTLETYLFQGCENLERAILPEGLINIPNDLFDGCTKISEVSIPSSVKKVGYDVFDDAGASATDSTIIVDVTRYKNPNSIAICDEGMLDYCEAETVKFKYDSSFGDDITAFTGKGWPAADSSSTPKIVWTNE